MIIYNRRRIIYDYLKSGSVCDCKGDLFDVIEMYDYLKSGSVCDCKGDLFDVIEMISPSSVNPIFDLAKFI